MLASVAGLEQADRPGPVRPARDRRARQRRAVPAGVPGHGRGRGHRPGRGRARDAAGGQAGHRRLLAGPVDRARTRPGCRPPSSGRSPTPTRCSSSSSSPGTEVAVSLLGGEPLPPVEIRPKEGVYDFAARYTAGATEFHVPARLDDDVRAACRRTPPARLRRDRGPPRHPRGPDGRPRGRPAPARARHLPGTDRDLAAAAGGPGGRLSTSGTCASASSGWPCDGDGA